MHPQGELAVARAAGAAGTIFCVSTASSYSLEEIADAATGPLWMQLYLWRSSEVVEGLVERARAAGYHALVLTIDVPVVGNRERDVRNGASLPPRIRLDTALDALRRPRWLLDFVRGSTITFANLAEIVGSGDPGAIGAYVDRELNDPSATWERLDWLRRLWDGPLVVKGVLSARDAVEAVRRGADAVYVSNHGGRQLDGSLGHARRAAGASSRRSATAPRCCSTAACGAARTSSRPARSAPAPASSGRPWFMALAAAGEPGVARMLELIARDIDRTLALVGSAEDRRRRREHSLDQSFG